MSRWCASRTAMLLAASASASVRLASSGVWVTAQIEPRTSSCSRSVATFRELMSASDDATKKGSVSVSIRLATPSRRTSWRNSWGTRWPRIVAARATSTSPCSAE